MRTVDEHTISDAVFGATPDAPGAASTGSPIVVPAIQARQALTLIDALVASSAAAGAEIAL